VRARLRRDLSWLGFGAFAPGVYLSPWEQEEEVARLIRRYGAYGQIQVFRAENVGPADNAGIVRRCWDLEGIRHAYQEFLATWASRYAAFQAGQQPLSDQECFVERYLLAHSYDRFPLIDPGLPRELLPPDWPGHEAARLFHAYHEALRPGAMRCF
jgi:phenylacetic acid degradation operon negative regulatory protein